MWHEIQKNNKPGPPLHRSLPPCHGGPLVSRAAPATHGLWRRWQLFAPWHQQEQVFFQTLNKHTDFKQTLHLKNNLMYHCAPAGWFEGALGRWTVHTQSWKTIRSRCHAHITSDQDWRFQGKWMQCPDNACRVKFPHKLVFWLVVLPCGCSQLF